MMTVQKKKEKFSETPPKERKKKYEHVRTKYHTNIQPYLGAIAAMCRNGATMDIIAEKFGITLSTLYEYRKKHSEFGEVLSQNAEIADFTVEQALYKNAVEGNLTAQIFWLKNRQARRWRDQQHVFQQQQNVQRFDYDNLSDEELEKEIKMLEAVKVEEEQEEGELH